MRRIGLLVTTLCASVLLSIPQSTGEVGIDEPRPIIEIRKHVAGNGSSYGLTVFPNGHATFYGFNTRVEGLRTLKVSRSQIDKALKVFEEIGFDKLESSEMVGYFGYATIILERDGVYRAVVFPTSGGSMREYAILIRSMEEIFQLHDLICPRIRRRNEELVDLCLIEKELFEKMIKGIR